MGTLTGCSEAVAEHVAERTRGLRDKCKSSSTGSQTRRESTPLQELARRWRVHPRTVKRRIKSGELEAFRIGTQIRIYNDSIEAFERRNRVL